ncbi:hypothetical protein PHYBOEH_002339 [Phytophthora boehmeriae]|uniref:Uncharacterized protein n=1 Tax=Phytophthora boehmeriae TaxID=109152 RepID=A0A8T1WX38_9STRA|nr:hypothetical protein PHYBOEH_002339 [Phytophthora boehmeriae]
MPGAKSSPSGPSTSSDDSVESHPVKKRKPTYLVRKEEEQALREEILQLEAQAAVFQDQERTVGAAVAADPRLRRCQVESKMLADTIRTQQLGVASTQSFMSECTRMQSTHPLHTRVHLQKEWSNRRDTLLAIRADKLRNAYQYVMARTIHLPEGQGQESHEHFETEDGDICCTGLTVLHFPGVTSLQQVYDALVFYLSNMEISITERLGHITVREDYDVIEGTAYNSRIVSSDESGLTTETNTIAFTQLFDKGDARFGGEPCAIIASDSVDVDELYPYQPSKNIRKDISGAVVLTVNTKQNDDECGGAVVVTMRRAGFLKLHHPEFPVAPAAMQELGSNIAKWGHVMVKAVRDILYAGNNAGETRCY